MRSDNGSSTPINRYHVKGSEDFLNTIYDILTYQICAIHPSFVLCTNKEDRVNSNKKREGVGCHRHDQLRSLTSTTSPFEFRLHECPPLGYSFSNLLEGTDG